MPDAGRGSRSQGSGDRTAGPRRPNWKGLGWAVVRTPARLRRWLGAWRELGRRRCFTDCEGLLRYARALADGRFDPYQIDAEICALLAAVRTLRPRVVLEIGTANGGTLLLFSRVAAPDAELISIDLPGGPFGGGYLPWRKPFYRRFALPGQQVTLMRADSHCPETERALRACLRGRPVDLLFLDGDHSYAGVRQDHERYAPLVRPGGIVAFHDIHPGPDEANEVPRYWGELRPLVAAWELIADPSQSGYGIGCYRKA